MATSLQLTLVALAILLSTFCFSRVTATTGGLPAPSSLDFAFSPESPKISPKMSHDIQESVVSPSTLFEPVLTSLGFQELATAIPSLTEDSVFSSWNGPSTLFAPTDASIRSCSSCSVSRLLREHVVPGLFSHEYLRKLAFGTKIETMDPGRCITITSSIDMKNNTKIFVGGVEITRPDLFNNGLVVVHGLQGYVTPLSPFSCNIERMTSLSFQSHTDHRHAHQAAVQHPTFIMRLMLREAMLRLRNSGFGIVALAMKFKFAELVNLHNMTVFAVDDSSIFSGSHSFVNNIRFHIVPNKLLALADLENMPSGTLLPTLERGQSLMITTAGGMITMRINYVRIKAHDIMHNLKIVVHNIYLPFPHLHPAAAAYGETIGSGNRSPTFDPTAMDNATKASCSVAVDHAGKVKPMVEKAEHHGL